jgi:predicted transcriptional regulator
VITVASWEVLGKVLSAPRLEILARIPVLRRKAIAALARSLKRDFKNVYADVIFLGDLGLIELKAEGKTLVPIARFAGTWAPQRSRALPRRPSRHSDLAKCRAIPKRL